MDNLSTYKEPMTCIFYATFNASKSCTMSEIWIECSNQRQYTKNNSKEIVKSNFVVSYLTFKGSIPINSLTICISHLGFSKHLTLVWSYLPWYLDLSLYYLVLHYVLTRRNIIMRFILDVMGPYVFDVCVCNILFRSLFLIFF